MPIPHASATKIVFNATGQQYRQTTSFTYLGGTVTETPNLSDEIDRRIRAEGMGFKRYRRELYDRPKVSLLPLKARMARSEVVRALLYGCATWTPLKGHYAKLRTTHHRMLLQILGAWCKSPNKRILSYKDALQRTKCESIETTTRTRRLLWVGALLRMGDQRPSGVVFSPFYWLTDGRIPLTHKGRCRAEVKASGLPRIPMITDPPSHHSLNPI